MCTKPQYEHSDSAVAAARRQPRQKTRPICVTRRLSSRAYANTVHRQSIHEAQAQERTDEWLLCELIYTIRIHSGGHKHA